MDKLIECTSGDKKKQIAEPISIAPNALDGLLRCEPNSKNLTVAYRFDNMMSLLAIHADVLGTCFQRNLFAAYLRKRYDWILDK